MNVAWSGRGASAGSTPDRRSRFVLLALGGAALISGLWGGLARAGLGLPVPTAAAVVDHGTLMVVCFLGTVISLERAVALERWWAYAAPLLAGLTGVSLLAGAPALVPKLLAAAAALTFVGASVAIIGRQLASFTLAMGVGALCWAVGVGLWLSGAAGPALVPWWTAFLVLTIAGERLELSRVLRGERGQVSFGLAAALLLIGAALGEPRVLGAALVALTAWLVIYDIARRTVRRAGLTRYVAVCLLSGQLWLGVGGALMLALGLPPAGMTYDAILHALFVGFVFSMIFGHAPIIVPAILGVRVPFHRAFYLPLTLLHLSLGLRVAGDLAVVETPRQLGSALNAAAIVLFILTVALTSIRHARRAQLSST